MFKSFLDFTFSFCTPKAIFPSVLLFIMVSCSSPTPSNELSDKVKKVHVLSTIAMIDDLVKAIGKEHLETSLLIRGELDPHSYQLVKGDDEKFASSDLIFSNGLGLEHGPSLQHLLHTNPKAIILGDLILRDYPQLILYQKGQLDPHIWMDVELWGKTIPYITQALSEKDPEHATDYQQNARDLQKQFAETHEQIRQELQAIPQEKRFLVTSHDAFNYFTRSYLAEENEHTIADWQKRFAAPEGLAPESQLSVADIQLIIDHLKIYQIPVIFPESNVSKDSIKKIVNASNENGVKVRIATVHLYADAMGSPGSDGDTYLKMIQHNAQAIASYLKQENTNESNP